MPLPRDNIRSIPFSQEGSSIWKGSFVLPDYAKKTIDGKTLIENKNRRKVD